MVLPHVGDSVCVSTRGETHHVMMTGLDVGIFDGRLGLSSSSSSSSSMVVRRYPTEEEDEGESTTTGDCVGHATRTGSMTGYCVGQTNGTRSMTGYCGGATGTIGTCVGYARGTRSMTGYGQGAARVGSSVGIMGGLEQAAKALIPTTATVPPALMSQTSKYRLLPSFN